MLEQLGHYRLMRLVAEGRCEVYEAEDTASGHRVALKLFELRNADDPIFRRAQIEARALARLLRPTGEPHLLLVDDVGEIDGRLYLQMPFVDGTDLQTLLSRGGPLSPTRAVKIVSQIAAALDAVQGSGAYCRDIVPARILVNDDDFAYLVCQPNLHDGLPDSSEPDIDPHCYAYSAPERFEAAIEGVPSASYSLTCVLYACLTGRPPFEGSVAEQIFGHRTKDPPQPSYLNNLVPATFDGVIARGMAKDPQLRFPSAGALAGAAEAALAWPAIPPARNRRRRLRGFWRSRPGR